MVGAIVCDLNGTIYVPKDDGDLFKAVGMAALKAAACSFDLARVRDLWSTKSKLEYLKGQIYRPDGTRDDDVVREMYRVFNEEAVAGMPVELVRRTVLKRARKSKVRANVDNNTLAAVRHVKKHSDTKFAVISEAYGEWIAALLHECVPDYIVANTLATDNGIAVGFTLDVFGNNKAEHLKRLADTYGINLADSVYAGDQECDEGCLAIVKYPIVSPHATPEFKQRCASRYGAFVPEKSWDMAKYIREL